MPAKNPLVRWGFDIEPKSKTKPLIHQVHGATILDASSLKEGAEADGVFTVEKDTTVFIFTADCLPVLFYGDSPSSPVMAVHAGWRGAKAGIAKNGLELMSRHSPRVTAVLGPSLGSCCFEVKDDFISEMVQARGNIERFLSHRDGKMYFDLVRFVVEEELKGIQGEVNTSAVRCTYCSRPELPSYRRNKGTDPRIRAWIYRLSQDENRLGRT